MEGELIFKIIILALLITASAIFSGSETALTTVNKIRIKTLAEEGNRRALLVQKVTKDSSKMLSAILIINNIANLSASSLATAVTIKLFGSFGVGIATGILTILILIFGEITPKTMATLKAERLSMRFAPLIYAVMVALTPVIFLINKLATFFLKLFGIDTKRTGLRITESEIRAMMDVGHQSGAIEEEEKTMINNLFDFGDTQAKEIMIPRINMTFAQINATYEEIIVIFKENKFTRLPVYEESTDNVVGILNMKDLLLCEEASFHIPDLLREPYFTYEHKNTADLFLEMRENSISLAIVLDEYGVTAGLITLEDLLEEIVGEIHDEYDVDDDAPIQKIAPNTYLVDASLSLEDLNDELGTDFYSEDYESIGGYMIEQLDHLPKTKEAITTEHGIFIQVKQKYKHQLEKLYIKIPSVFYQDSEK